MLILGYGSLAETLQPREPQFRFLVLTRSDYFEAPLCRVEYSDYYCNLRRMA